MCGGCPGGTGISRLSAYAALTGIKPGVGALLQEIAGRRLMIRPFGDQWTVRTRLGHQSVLAGLEEVAAAVAAGPLDWTAVSVLTGADITGAAPALRCPAEPALEQIAAAPRHGAQPVLPAGPFTAALLVRAANARVR